MQTEYIGAYSVPDGYFGDRKTIYLCFDPESSTLQCVWEGGVYTDPIFRTVSGAPEAKWLIGNHPNGKKYFKNWKTGR